jgi:hypothetical protein
LRVLTAGVSAATPAVSISVYDGAVDPPSSWQAECVSVMAMLARGRA